MSILVACQDPAMVAIPPTSAAPNIIQNGQSGIACPASSARGKVLVMDYVAGKTAKKAGSA